MRSSLCFVVHQGLVENTYFLCFLVMRDTKGSVCLFKYGVKVCERVAERCPAKAAFYQISYLQVLAPFKWTDAMQGVIMTLKTCSDHPLKIPFV